MEDDLKKMKKMEGNLKKIEDGLKQKWKTDKSPKINLLGCDTIVNSPILLLVSNNNIIYSLHGWVTFDVIIIN